MSSHNFFQRPFLWRLRSVEKRSILLIGDLTVSLIALLAALYFWAQKDTWYDFSIQFFDERIPFWFYLLPFLWISLLIELYDGRRSGRKSDTIQGVTIAAAACLVLYLLVYFTSEPNSLPRMGVAVFVITNYVLTILWRMMFINIFTAPLFMRRVLIVGAGRAGSTLANIIKESWPPPFYLVGLIDDNPKKIHTEIEGFPVLGGCNNLMDIIKDENISDIIFSITGDMSNEMYQSLLISQEQGIVVSTMAQTYEEILGRVPISLLQSDWVLRTFVDQAHVSIFYELAKRILDIVGGLVGGVILAMTFPIISLAILLDTGKPIFYFQNRLGKNGRIYKIYKYRTMRQDAERDGVARPAVANDKRITRIGYFLRKSHLDELPQFINILSGSMSLVGPRAERLELVHDLQTKVPFYRARLLVKPGLTGWAQINYGYASTVKETATKLEYDLYYIKHRNLILDIEILLRTLGTVLGFRGQ